MIKAREMQEAGEKAGRESAADVRFPRRDGRRVLPEGRRTGGRLLHEVKSAQAVLFHVMGRRYAVSEESDKNKDNCFCC